MKRGILFLSLALLFVPFVSSAQNNNEVTGALLINITDSIVTHPAPTPPVEKKSKVKTKFKTIEFKKGYQQEVSFAYSYMEGSGEYIPLHQLNFNYIGGYRFNHFFYAGIGTGLDFAANYNFKPLLIESSNYNVADSRYYKKGDKISYYDTYRNRLPIQKVSIPLYVHLRTYFMKTKWSPFIAFSAGVRFSVPKKADIHEHVYKSWTDGDIGNYIRTEKYGATTGMFELMPGVNYQHSKDLSFNFQFGYAARSGHSWLNWHNRGYTIRYQSDKWWNGITMRFGVTF